MTEYTCQYCGETFNEQEYRLSHVEREHKGTVTRLYHCEGCGTVETPQTYIDGHVRRCTVCDVGVTLV